MGAGEGHVLGREECVCFVLPWSPRLPVRGDAAGGPETGVHTSAVPKQEQDGGRQGPAHRRSVCSQQEAWAGKFGVRCLCPGSRSTERPCPWSVASPPQPGTTPCSCEWLPGPLWGQFRCCHQKAVTWISNETPDCELDGLLTSCPAVRPSEFLQQDEMTQEDRLIIEHGTVGSSHADIQDAPNSNRTLSRHRGPAEKA